MSTQLITPSRPAPSAPGSGHRRIHAAAAAVAALIAIGGYLAIATIGPDATPRTARTGTEVNPSAQALRELHQSVAGQYASRSAAAAVVNPSAQARREMHETIAGQYRSQPVARTVVNPTAQALREMNQTVAGQYRSRPAPDATVAPKAQVRRELRQSITGQYAPAR